MPTYAFKCMSCENEFDRILPLAEHDAPQACPECEVGPAKRVLSSTVGFVLKGDGWSGKNIKIRNQMSRRREGLASKEHERKMDGPGMRLAPNVGGERVDSWSEAQRMAKSQGKDTTSYDGVVRKEQEGRR